MGINISRYKVTAFALSGLIAGIAGAFYAHYICFISPDTFVYNDSITILTMVLIGGSGTVAGPIIGAVLLTLLPELLRSLVQYRMLIYGLIVRYHDADPSERYSRKLQYPFVLSGGDHEVASSEKRQGGVSDAA